MAQSLQNIILTVEIFINSGARQLVIEATKALHQHLSKPYLSKLALQCSFMNFASEGGRQDRERLFIGNVKKVHNPRPLQRPGHGLVGKLVSRNKTVPPGDPCPTITSSTALKLDGQPVKVALLAKLQGCTDHESRVLGYTDDPQELQDARCAIHQAH